MLKIINKTDSALSIENYELPERGSVEIDIPYTSNLKMMERCNMIAVIEVPSELEETVESESKPRKRNRKTSNN